MSGPGNQFIKAHYDMGTTWTAGGPPARRHYTERDHRILDLLQPPEWHAQAACKGQTGLFYPELGENSVNGPRRICETCPVQKECLDAGMRELHGVWGGTTPKERRKLRRELGIAAPRQIKLTEQDVIDLRAAWRAGTAVNTLAARYSVDRKTIRRALTGEAFPHVPDPITADQIGAGGQHRTKLSRDQVAEIRAEAAAGTPVHVLAARFETTKPNIRKILARRTWTHTP